MSCPGREALDACAAGELTGEQARTIEAHAAGCDACGRRLSWLRRENEEVRQWADGDDGVEHLWAGIESRLGRKRTWPRWAAVAAVAAAASVLLLARPHAEPDEVTPSAEAALASAEQDYARAAATLEAQIAARPAGRHEASLSRTRTRLKSALASAGDEPAARVRVLEGYAAYLKSLRRALQDTP